MPGVSAAPRSSRPGIAKWTPMPSAHAATSARRMYTVGSGDEADPAGFLGAELDEGEAGGRDDVGASLDVGEGDMGRVLLERGGDLRTHLVSARARLEAQLAARVDDAD